jgi:hypothetical protein
MLHCCHLARLRKPSPATTIAVEIRFLRHAWVHGNQLLLLQPLLLLLLLLLSWGSAAVLLQFPTPAAVWWLTWPEAMQRAAHSGVQLQPHAVHPSAHPVLQYCAAAPTWYSSWWLTPGSS